MKKLILVLISILFVSTVPIQAKAQQNNTAVENATEINQINQLAEIKNIIQTVKVNVNRNLDLLAIAIKYHNGEIILNEDELLEIKKECIEQAGEFFEQINYLVSKFGYPREAFERAEVIIPKQYLDFTKTVVEISQLNLSPEEKINVLFETFAGGGCGVVLEYFFYSLAAGVVGIIYGIINAVLVAAIPPLGLILLLFPGILVYAVAILGAILFISILGLSPILLILCLTGVL
jgi:hypothetical protein